jgi:hypothetical protein
LCCVGLYWNAMFVLCLCMRARKLCCLLCCVAFRVCVCVCGGRGGGLLIQDMQGWAVLRFVCWVGLSVLACVAGSCWVGSYFKAGLLCCVVLCVVLGCVFLCCVVLLRCVVLRGVVLECHVCVVFVFVC